MQYFRIKRHIDNVYSPVLQDYRTFVENELITRREMETVRVQKYRLPADAIETVTTPKGNTYWFFGARFALDETKVQTIKE
jgi:hypothetical protein